MIMGMRAKNVVARKGDLFARINQLNQELARRGAEAFLRISADKTHVELVSERTGEVIQTRDPASLFPKKLTTTI